MDRCRILDLDIENRPLAYLGQDFTTAEITAIAASFGPGEGVRCWLLGRDDPREMLAAFRKLYDEADIVTGHYIRAHDLPIINGAMMEYKLPTLAPKMSIDTKIDLVAARYLSKSQENLCHMLGVSSVKTHMSNAEWREANRLTPRGLKKTFARAVGDVVQHMALRKVLVERDLLGSPRVWRP